MNKRQKEVIGAQLTDEQKTIKELKQVYKKAQADVGQKISELLARTDTENLSSIVYQINYQQAILKQIEGTLNVLNSEQFNSISDFLGKSYANGYMGVMYDLQGQGIPIIAPIDNEMVVKALQTDSQISDGLYKKLGVNTKELKDSIRANLSRGVSAGLSWDAIAKNIDSRMNIGLNRSIRIARTEGHRVQCEAGYQAQQVAKSKGADIVKQWCATLDGRTRPNHRLLDGVIKPIDEPFEMDGYEGMYPSDFGVAREDINCRCTLLQRAKWGLDSSELETLKDRAAYYGLDKTADFEAYKQTYLKLPSTAAEQSKMELQLSDFPDEYTDTKAKSKRTEAFMDYVNGVEGADPDVLELYRRMGQLHADAGLNGVEYKVMYSDTDHALNRWNYRSGGVAKVQMRIPKMEGADLDGQAETTAHEFGHLIDFYSTPNKGSRWLGSSTSSLADCFKTKDISIGDEAKQLFSGFKQDYIKINSDLDTKYAGLRKANRSKFDNREITGTAYVKELKRLQSERDKEEDYLVRNAARGVNGLQDIYDALSWGEGRDSGAILFGHGSRYYSNNAARPEETFANYCSLSLTHPELIEVLERDKPEVVKACRSLVSELLGR